LGLVIDTSTVAPHERMELWSAATSAVFFPSEVRSVDDAPYVGVMRRYAVGPLDVVLVRGTALDLRRTPQDVTAADPEIFSLSILRGGRLRATQEGRDSHVGPGVACAYDSSRPLRMRTDAPFDQVVVAVPKELLRPFTDHIARRTATPVSLHTARGRLVVALMRQMLAEIDGGTIGPQDSELSEALVALMRGLFTNASDGGPVPVQTALMRAIKDHIEVNLTDRGLGPESVARSQFISTRYLQSLFQREGVTVSGWIRSRRLERSRRDLQDPALAHEPIAAIAARWGFGSASHFTHVVRTEYGCSPRELRAGGPG
jgi:AraC-like DNA-binding protein